MPGAVQVLGVPAPLLPQILIGPRATWRAAGPFRGGEVTRYNHARKAGQHTPCGLPQLVAHSHAVVQMTAIIGCERRHADKFIAMIDVTTILARIEQGDSSAADALLPLVYTELRRLAAAKLAQERPGQTLQATALVHEAYLRLLGSEQPQNWNTRNHFFAAAAEAMRRILVDAARRKAARKHGGEYIRQDLQDSEISCAAPVNEILSVHDALDGLEAEDRLAADLVKLNYFGGFTLDEAAELLGMSRATAYRLWTYARAWLRAELEAP